MVEDVDAVKLRVVVAGVEAVAANAVLVAHNLPELEGGSGGEIIYNRWNHDDQHPPATTHNTTSIAPPRNKPQRTLCTHLGAHLVTALARLDVDDLSGRNSHA